MIDLRRLRVLRVLAEHGTVTATAEALHLTPSAVSQQIRQLGQELGTQLLRPDGRRVRLTPAARVLLRHDDILQAQWEAANAELHTLDARVSGVLRLCGVSSVLAALAAPAAVRLRHREPLIDVRILEEESTDCYRLLMAEETDVAPVLPGPDVPPVTDERFAAHPLHDDRQDLLVPEAHPFAARTEGVELADAAGETWIVKRRNNDTYPLLSAACSAAGFTPHIAHEVKEWYAVSALVAAGLGICLLPRMVPLPPHPVVRVPLCGQPVPARRIVAVTRRGSAHHPVIGAGLDALHHAARTARGED